MEIIRGKVVENGWRYLFIHLLSYRRYFTYIYTYIYISPLFFHLCLIQHVRLWLWTTMKFFIRIEMQCFTHGLRNIAVTYTISLGFIHMFYVFVQLFFNMHKEEDNMKEFRLGFNVHMYKYTQWMYAEII